MTDPTLTPGPGPGPGPAPAPGPGPAPGPPDQTKKVMAIIIAVLCGTVAGLIAYLLGRHLGATPLEGLGCSGISFLAVTSLVKAIEEKVGVL
ncbi:hypothetical protein [Streptomyces sp. NRRL S-118]|uniref:hypothetical protein n=1 Tax=Streptomyces sp. NRRL S-118 TaxID=1463881 RepID=UPI00099C81D0|nr:hypothetical protein [Streptomyces sp. NRRL S-118]